MKTLSLLGSYTQSTNNSWSISAWTHPLYINNDGVYKYAGKHPWPFNDEVVIYVRNLGPSVVVTQAWQEGKELKAWNKCLKSYVVKYWWSKITPITICEEKQKLWLLFYSWALCGIIGEENIRVLLKSDYVADRNVKVYIGCVYIRVYGHEGTRGIHHNIINIEKSMECWVWECVRYKTCKREGMWGMESCLLWVCTCIRGQNMHASGHTFYYKNRKQMRCEAKSKKHTSKRPKKWPGCLCVGIPAWNTPIGILGDRQAIFSVSTRPDPNQPEIIRSVRVPKSHLEPEPNPNFQPDPNRTRPMHTPNGAPQGAMAEPHLTEKLWPVL